MRRLSLLLAKIIAKAWPGFLISLFYRFAVGSQDLALCLHRVLHQRRSTDPYSDSTIEEEKLRYLLELVEKHHRSDKSRIFITFDDGYHDATQFVRKVAPLYPHLHWIIFVCPKKIEKRLGFRWDRFELARNLERDPLLQSLQGSPAYDFQRLPKIATDEGLLAHITKNSDPNFEAVDPSLVGLGDLDLFQLSSIQDLKEAGALPKVKLGNHSNAHLKFTKMQQDLFEQEVDNSIADMERLFGKTSDFAFPFGTPEKDYTPVHSEYLRKRQVGTIWNTYSAPFRRSEYLPGAVLPRFVVIGSWSAKRIVAYLAIVSLFSRWSLFVRS